MSLLLASLFSAKSMSAGLMIYDTVHSCHRYVQILDLSSLPVRINQIRGISMIRDRLYALVPCAMLIFRIDDRNKAPLFNLEKTVCLPEWILGDSKQGNLHAVYASDEQKKVYISFNNQCAIDIFDLEGNFIKRRYLWDIAPDYFYRPIQRINKGFMFGIIRQIFETEQKELLLSTALINGKRESAIISFNSGRTYMNWASEPLHGGLIDKSILYVSAIQKGEVHSFSWPKNQEYPDKKPMVSFSPKITDPKFKRSEQKTRGLIVKKNRLYCGVCYFGKPKAHQIPPRIVEFNIQNGDQAKEHWLPSFQGFEEPHVYSLLTVSSELEKNIKFPDKPVIYRGEKTIKTVFISCDATIKKKKTEDANNTDISRKAKTIQKSGTFTKNEEYDWDLKDKTNFNKPINYQKQVINDLKNTENEESKTPYVNSNSNKNKILKKELCRPTVIFENVGLCYERAARKLLSFNINMRNKKKFWALRDISFTVNEGETLGVIGRNGSGKSTLSMICSGVLIPDRGRVKVNGRIQLLALGVGFKNELSGRENVYISGSLLGLSKKKIRDHMADIEEFAELGIFMDEPVRTYSSGMRSRLGFAVATAVKPDILVLDEIMATGDKAFKDKAMRRMREMRSLARSVIVVSHNPSQLRKLCTKVLWLEKGRLFMLGDPKETLNAYDDFCKNPAKWFQNNPEMDNKVNFDEQKND